jgi:hypothetical protein
MRKKISWSTFIGQIQRDLEDEMLKEDIYTHAGAAQSLENDEITPAEMGFMTGYLAA